MKMSSILAVVVVFGTTTLHAATTWKGAVDGDWNLESNWTDGVPTG